MVRVRFAPSPTGELHIGSARTVLYNYLFARQNQGSFILRIEDTDQARFVPGSMQRIIDGLHWLGLTWDEGPDVGGPYGPYVQSERTELYQHHARSLLEQGNAYWCFCSPEKLNLQREAQQALHQPTRYDRTCLALSNEEISSKLEKGEAHVLRLKVPVGITTVHDIIRGDVTVKNSEIDDQVLLKSDGFPTYHLANVVDDHLMQITHVIRGEEWLSSTPKHLMLYQAFGWQPPAYGHIPNVLNAARSKLSKRKDGEAVWVETYHKLGYLPQAMVNFLSLLGWHPQDDTEIFTLPELVSHFSLERVQKAGAIFDLTRLKWFNQHYIKALPVQALDLLLQPWYQEQTGTLKKPLSSVPLTQVLQSRLTLLSDAVPLSAWFFAAKPSVTPELLIPNKGKLETTQRALELAQSTLSKVGEWTVMNIRTALMKCAEASGLSRQELLWPVRVAITGERESPDVADVAWALGKERTLERLTNALLVI